MDFPFDINAIIKEPITKVDGTLLPNGFSQERHSSGECAAKITIILDEMGVASAKAQGLQTAVTGADRLKNSDHFVYLYINPRGNNGKGSVIGLLKMGHKKLFVYDETGAQNELSPLCVLDFYIHESMQRVGCGKFLYDYMLKKDNVSPHDLAIDKPSEKFLGFLYKHYGLERIIPQNNNYVVYEGFFKPNAANKHAVKKNQSIISRTTSESLGNSPSRVFQELDYQCSSQPSYGRHAARKPVSTMAKILSTSAGKTQNEQQQRNGNVTPPLSLSSDDLASNQIMPSAVDNEPDTTYRRAESLYEEPLSLSSSTCRLDSSPEKLDLKFHHSPLW